ncbi:uncharacterized protein LOC117822697 [Notolabrus celidotus]|uniref:uncharacterized protein LOC117822697 n=1 Tax=Notolabrus celidotus TaxID=1203425 RepID=UPI00148FA55C|nr:uncharacterized protein LOC117822697 [Notolabrus celidotus]
MSVTMTKADGVTVLTLTSDPQSAVPPICQILKSLCYSPVCCSVSQHLKKIQGSSQSALGAMQIMIGLLNIGLGAILTSSGAGSSWQMDSSLFPFWIGGLFIFFGTMSILSEKCPSPCLVILNVILNVSGVAFAIAAIVLYSINIADIYMWWECELYSSDYGDYGYRHRRTTQPPSPEQIRMKEKCLEAQNLSQMLLRSINAVLIVLSVMALCITLSSAILGIKALRRREKGENKSNGDPELYKPLLEEFGFACGQFRSKHVELTLKNIHLIRISSVPASLNRPLLILSTVRMSLTKTEADGVTVITLTSDPSSHCPPFCQLLKALCYSPRCLPKSLHLKRIQGSSQSVLGALQILLGLLNIGCGAIITDSAPWWQKYNYLFPFWLGGMFILFGITCILSEKCPRPYLVILNVVLNLSGIGFAIAAILLYMLNIMFMNMSWLCEPDGDFDYSQYKTPSPLENSMMKKCLGAQLLTEMILISMNAMLIVLSVLELCIVISSAVLGIKALCKTRREENQSPDDPEHRKPPLEKEVRYPAV